MDSPVNKAQKNKAPRRVLTPLFKLLAIASLRTKVRGIYPRD
jgi:hypothetical protein